MGEAHSYLERNARSVLNKKRNRTVLRMQNRYAFRQMVERKREAGDLPPLEYVAIKNKSKLSGKVAEEEETVGQ